MVEFGAGGQLTHEIEATGGTAATTAGAAEGGAAEGAAGGPAAAAATTPAEQPRRRKRKAKGWFCPVCRQPYTALLRITTTPPGKRLSEDSFHAPALPAATTETATGEPAVPPAAHVAPTNQATDATNASGATSAEGGGMLSGLLGGLSLRGKKEERAPSGSEAV
ncbi:hypothetical protein FRB90_000660 [Tulasnella sp. 427]|nr:hypothetical protein FRB90_000660 [Tulasnella sp. 427]